MNLPRESASLFTLVALYVFLAFAAPQFYDPAHLRDLAMTNISVLIVAIGMTLVLIVSQIDISVGALFAVCTVATGWAAQAGVPVFLLPVVALLVGSLLGALNGSLVSFVKAPSIVVTLAAMVAWREALRWRTGGAWIENLPHNFQWFGLSQRGGEVFIIATALALFVAFWLASRHLLSLRAVYATGSDSEAARLAGIPTTKVVFWVFVLTGALTGLAAVLNAVRFADVPVNTGINLELKVIAAVIVGGTPISGGRGSLIGTFFGVLLLGSIGPALSFLGVNPHWEKALQGAIILTAVMLYALGGQRRTVPKWAD